MNTLNPEKLSDEELVNYFEEAFSNQVAMNNEITSFEATCDREGGKIRMRVEIVGMAGSPTPEAFEDGQKMVNRDKVVVDEGDFGSMEFQYIEKPVILNSTDYFVLYEVV